MKGRGIQVIKTIVRIQIVNLNQINFGCSKMERSPVNSETDLNFTETI